MDLNSFLFTAFFAEADYEALADLTVILRARLLLQGAKVASKEAGVLPNLIMRQGSKAH